MERNSIPKRLVASRVRVVLIDIDSCCYITLLTSAAFCSSAVGMAKSSASSAVATPGRETITEATDVAATSRRNSALVCADSCVVVEDEDGRTNASDEAKRAETRNMQ